MANFNKSFNFRNGVQVDDDNFVVNPNGQVGIGSTIPTEFFDLRGNATISGLTTTQSLFAGIGTVGVLTATHAGITTLAVEAIEIDGLTIRTVVGYHTLGWNIDYAYGGPDAPASFGSGSGISTTLKVGIGATQAIGQYDLTVGLDPALGRFSGGGVAINDGHIHAAGIITASQHFVGVGSLVTQLNADSIEYGTISDSRLPNTITSNIVGNLTGDVTGTADLANNLTGSPSIEVTAVDANNAYINSGIVTHLTSTNSTTGVATVSSILHSSGNIGIGSAIPSVDLDIHKASPVVHVQSSTGEANLKVVADDDRANIDIVSLNDEARIRFSNYVGTANTSAMIRFGAEPATLDIINNDTGDIRFILDNSPVGVDTGAFSWKYGSASSANLMTLTYEGKLGLGVTNPSEDIQVGGGISVGQKAYFTDIEAIGVVTTSSKFFGDGSGLHSLNLPGTIRGSVIDQSESDGTSVSAASTFTQLHVYNNNPNIESRPGISSLGIGTDNPRVGADGTFEYASFKGIGIGTFDPFEYGMPGAVENGMDPSLLKPEYIRTGQIALGVEGMAMFTQVGVGTTYSSYPVCVKNSTMDFSGLGTGTSNIYAHNSYVSLGIRADLSDQYSSPGGPYGDSSANYSTDSGLLFIGCKSSIVHGGLTSDYLDTDVGRSIFDYGNVGIATTLAPMIIPTVTTSQRGTIRNFQDSGDPVEGSIIFNTTTKKFQGWTGTTWVDFH